MSGEATPKGAVSTFGKMYRQVFKKAKIAGTSHMFRHMFSVVVDLGLRTKFEGTPDAIQSGVSSTGA